MQATDGNFYGTSNYVNYPSFGAIFRVTPQGEVTTLHSFNGGDGEDPWAALVQGTDGSLYGTAIAGRAYNPCGGMFFRITLSGTFTLLHSFGFADGCGPNGIVEAADGNFYGTTYGGGAYDGAGTVFKITPSGVFTALYNFSRENSGPYYPVGNLVLATDGRLYGVTTLGGSNGFGTIFAITTDGQLQTLHEFDYATGYDSFTPQLIQATDGNLLRDGDIGSDPKLRRVRDWLRNHFQLTPAGAYTNLYSLASAAGAIPSGLLQDTDGNLYGTTFQGGVDNNDGIFFQLSLGLGAFVKTLPGSATIGMPVTIFGSDLSGTTAVSFNGVSASFSIVSATQISATVPTGATTGPVQVTTGSGTLVSNVPFRAGLDFEAAPIGVLDTPAPNTTNASGAIAFTGWALSPRALPRWACGAIRWGANANIQRLRIRGQCRSGSGLASGCRRGFPRLSQ